MKKLKTFEIYANGNPSTMTQVTGYSLREVFKAKDLNPRVWRCVSWSYTPTEK